MMNQIEQKTVYAGSTDPNAVVVEAFAQTSLVESTEVVVDVVAPFADDQDHD